jgi:hypothetical protein
LKKICRELHREALGVFDRSYYQMLLELHLCARESQRCIIQR